MLAPPSMGKDYEAAFNPLFSGIAAKHIAYPLIPFFLDGVAGNPSLQLPDGIHPNQRRCRQNGGKCVAGHFAGGRRFGKNFNSLDARALLRRFNTRHKTSSTISSPSVPVSLPSTV
jgi:hypothetical protein